MHEILALAMGKLHFESFLETLATDNQGMEIKTWIIKTLSTNNQGTEILG